MRRAGNGKSSTGAVFSGRMLYDYHAQDQDADPEKTVLSFLLTTNAIMFLIMQ